MVQTVEGREAEEEEEDRLQWIVAAPSEVFREHSYPRLEGGHERPPAPAAGGSYHGKGADEIMNGQVV